MNHRAKHGCHRRNEPHLPSRVHKARCKVENMSVWSGVGESEEGDTGCDGWKDHVWKKKSEKRKSMPRMQDIARHTDTIKGSKTQPKIFIVVTTCLVWYGG